MSGRYSVDGYRLLDGSGTELSDEKRRSLSCSRCNWLLHNAFQLSCGCLVCEECAPKTKVQCPSGHGDIEPEKGFKDNACRKEINNLMVECECKTRFAIGDWEDHRAQCPEVVRCKPTEEQGLILDFSEEQRGSLVNNPTFTSGGADVVVGKTVSKGFPVQLHCCTFGNVSSFYLAGSIIRSSPYSLQNSHKSEMVLGSVTGESSDKRKAISLVKKYVVARPKVLFILNANDSSLDPLNDLDARETCNLLEPKVKKLGICFLPVVNESKEFLEAVLDVLINEFFPKSIELVKFVSSTHGRCNEIYMNGEFMRISDIIERLGKLPCKYFLALFDGCETNHETKKTLDVVPCGKFYMVVYSAPPGYRSYYWEGVGIFTRCLARVLENSSVRTLKQLVDKVSEDLIVQLPKYVNEVTDPVNHQLTDPVNHQPVCVHNFKAEAVDFQAMITPALKARVEHASEHEGVMAKFDIYSPARMLYDDNFELISLIVAVDYDGARCDLKKMTEVLFDMKYEIEIELPPCAEARNNNVIVTAFYGDGRKVESDPITVNPPKYVKAEILSTQWESCKLRVNFLVRPDELVSDLYKVSSIQLQRRSSERNQWQRVHEGDQISLSNAPRNVLVEMPHHVQPTTYQFRIVKHYDCTSTDVFSDVTDVDQKSIARPIVCPVERTNGYQQKKVKVNITKCCEQCDVQSCVISYEVNGTVCHINSDVSRQQNEAEVMVPFETTKLKAEVEYRNFGSIESTELYTSNSNLDKVVKKLSECFCKDKCRICTLASLVPVLLVLFALITLVLIYFPSTRSDETILVAGYTMVHSFLQPTFWTSILYKGVTVYLDYKSTDNSNITITVGACTSLTPLPSPLHLPQENLEFGSGRSCRYFTGQQFNSLYFVAGSSVSGNVTVRIQRGGTFHYAKLIGTREYVYDLNSLCSNIEMYEPVLSVDINNSALNQVFGFSSRPLKEDTVMYLLVQTKAFGNVTVDTQVVLDRLYYPSLSDIANGTCDILDTAGEKKNASINFSLFKGKKNYIFVANRANESRFAHFVFVLHPRYEVKIFAIVMLSVCFLFLLFQLFCLCFYDYCLRCLRTCNLKIRDAISHSSVNSERTPLLSRKFF